MRTQTARNETAVAIPPFLISSVGGARRTTVYPAPTEPVGTVTRIR